MIDVTQQIRRKVVSSTVAQVLHCLYPPSAIDIRGNRMTQTRKRYNLFVLLIIDDRAACRNLHRAGTHIHAFLFHVHDVTQPAGPFHTAKRAHSTSTGSSHCRGRECEKPWWRRFYARCTTRPSPSPPLGHSKASNGRRISFANHKLEAPEKKR